MDSQDLEAFVRAQLIPSQTIVAAGQELEPILIFECPDGMGIASVADYGQDEAKGPLRHMMRALLLQKQAMRYCFIMEAWTGHQKLSEMTRDYRPKNDPARTESIVISGADREGRKICLTCAIHREGGIRFGEPEIIPVVSAPLLELLETPTVN